MNDTPQETLENNPLETQQASRPETPFPVVGIGASAGGLAAFEAFFSGMPQGTEPGMAFVLVQHLAPDHKSLLTELVQRYTRMKVLEVEDGMVVVPNCTYIIPPNRDMALLNGALHLMEPMAPRGQRSPIDFFFRSLAMDLRERAIGVVLSGTGTDGTLGVRAMKGEGGMVMAQSPSSAEYDGMPRSAIATGLVDYVLPPAEMASQLIAYTARALSTPTTPTTLNGAPVATANAENALKKICVILRAQTGHDFSRYKPSTIHRRFERRMAVHEIDTIDEYILFLQRNPAEVDALFNDLLIGVTSFFRDPEAFKVLEEQIIPKLFANRPSGSTIRIWSPGCSTGEEAYSLAILLQEHLDVLKQNVKVQIFGTDIDARAINVARSGTYAPSVAADLSPARLGRFFMLDSGSYRIHKSIRDMLIFSEQDLLRDPPFSKMDLISCRNLLIYLGAELQKKVISLFHYALNPSGYLFLGTSETVGEPSELFNTVDRRMKLYQRRGDSARPAETRYLPTTTLFESASSRTTEKLAVPKRLSLRELTEQALLQEIAPACALVHGNGDILYLHGRTGQFLEPTPGEAAPNNILKMAREGLRVELATALHRAEMSREVVRFRRLNVKTNGNYTKTNLTVRPMNGDPSAPTEAPLFLVILEALENVEAEAVASNKEKGTLVTDIDARFLELKEELRTKEEYLKSTLKDLELSNEELKSSNEEMQSVNEELQSTNEELETSKEELQSINEELSTVNGELQAKVVDLSRANNDMNNLLAGTNIGTVFVDHQLRILRFTPAVTQVINLIPSDVGRPMSHLASNLVGYDNLIADTQSVLETLIPKEIDVQTRTGAFFAMRILPYRTLENVIEGAVITFVDITKIKSVQMALRESEEKYRNLFTYSPDAVFISHREQVAFVNQACLRLFGARNEAELVGRSIFDLFHKDFHGQVQEQLQRPPDVGAPVAAVPEKIVRINGESVDVEVLAASFSRDGMNDIHFIVRNISTRKRTDDQQGMKQNERKPERAP